MHFDDERRAMVLASISFIRGQFASNGIDLGAYSDDHVADALLITCPAILGSEAWLNEKHLQRTIRLLRT
jgi:hypothetical protein